MKNVSRPPCHWTLVISVSIGKDVLKITFAAQTHSFVVSTVLVAPFKMYLRLTFTAQMLLVVVSTVLVALCRTT